jgi:lipid A 3-O-deacylase
MKPRSHCAPHAPSLTRWIAGAAVSFACAALVPPAHGDSLAPDGVDVTGGQGHSVFVSGVGVHWNGLCQCLELKQYGFDTRLVAQLSYWHAQVHPTDNGSLWDAGLTPVLRWLWPGATAVQPYVEAGVGVHLLSHTRINNDRVLSTAFQFGENAGTGIAFGEQHRFELGVYVQHESNARIKQPNNGLTYLGAVLRVGLF